MKPESKPVGGSYRPVYHTQVVPQRWSEYSETDHGIWAELVSRQSSILPGRACDAFMSGLARLSFSEDRIPDFEADVNPVLEALSGWNVVGVEGLIPEKAFFTHLSEKRFPVTRWIRTPEQAGYLPEPDLFHDLYGHVPMLTDPRFGDFVQAYGKGGLRALSLDKGIARQAIRMLTRLYWYTVEFGLIRENGGLRIYGGGVLSSSGESAYAVESGEPHRIPFNLTRAMRTAYPVDTYQETYFVIDSVGDLMRATDQDFEPLYRTLAGQPVLRPEYLQPGEKTISVA